MKKIIVLLLTMLMAFSVVGCGDTSGGGNNGGDLPPVVEEEKDLEGKLTIKVMDKGYGTKFAEELCKAYKEINPDFDYEVIPDANIPETLANELPLGPDLNKTSIYFGSSVNYPEYFESTKYGDKFGYESFLYDFRGFLQNWETYDGISVKDALPSTLIDMLSIEGRTFGLPWAAGACGIVYREDIFKEVGIEVPKTTDELLACVKSILDYNAANPDKKPIYPFIWSGGNAAEYWEYVTNVWWAQYEGYDRFMKYWSLNDGNMYSPKKDYLMQEGQLKALEVTQKLVKAGVSYPGSQNNQSDAVQRLFVKEDSQARFAMIPNGDWFENEVKKGGCTESELARVKMMVTPKLSAAVAKHGEQNVTDYAYTLSSTHNVSVPAYAAEKYLIKDFLSFVYSGDGAKIFTKFTGSFLALNDFDYIDEAVRGEMTNYQLSQLNIVSNTDYLYTTIYKSPLRYAGTLKKVPEGKDFPEIAMANGKTAKQVWDDYNKYHNSNWSNYLADAGL